MGHPLHNGNGSSPTNGASHDNEPGPSSSSSNGHASSSSIGPGSLPPHVLGSIQHVLPPGNLMYEDDRSWNEHPDVAMADDGKEGTDDELEVEDGLSHHEGRAISRKPTQRPGVGGGRRMPVEREEAVRLILQGLRDIGYHQSADVLELESGYNLSTPHANEFQSAILGGRWSEALGLLPELGIPISSTTSEPEPASSSSSIASGKLPKSKGTNSISDQMKFLISQQKYLEYLEIGQQKKALGVLRGELNRVAKDQEVLHTLSGFMMCLDKDDLYERAMWDGAQGTSRRQLLEHLQAFISPQIMVPSRRLATLFDQARRHQQLSCLYHEEPESTSLYTDHRCESGVFPSITTHVLADHTDEVWRIEWSPDGMYLASAGKDKTVVIWQLKESGGSQYSVVPFQHLKEHSDPVDAMAWSPDGKTLVTGADKNIYVWDVKSGELRPKPSSGSQHSDTISAIQWLPDGSEFVVASMDCKVVFYTPAGNLLRQWSAGSMQLNDFVITPDGKRIVAITTPLKRVSHNDKLKQSMSARPSDESETIGPVTAIGPNGGPLAPFQYATMEHSLAMIHLRCETTSIKISSDGRKIIVSCSPDEIQVWSIDPGFRYLRKHSGHVQGHFLIRSCFGAPKDRFVLSGSEDGHVYVWQGSSPNPIEVLSGHTSVVNAVAWNPVAARRIFASCSDDSTIRIWQPPLNLDEMMNIEGNGDGIKVEDDGEEDEEGMVL
uniref:WD-repeat protein n=1 Tax=Kwoniella bestiolae CBS 10118 TaxID=1296100 RepID=A0A1B9GE18_9TREE|nr:WD-repeat protein [Kwoniella bestiolae CBS 10118]OCF29312.1 WD-repeat protein [Kwoniella bestiolae CBS 10118]